MRPGRASRRARASDSILLLRLGLGPARADEVQLDLPRAAEDGRPGVVEGPVDGGGELVHVALAHGRDPQHAGPYDARPHSRAQERQHLVLEERLHLAGRAGKQDEHPALVLEALARGGAARVRQRHRPLDQVGLLLVDRRHRPPEAGEARPEHLEEGGVADEAAAEGGRRGLAREVVGGGPEPAGRDHHVGPGERRRGRRTRRGRGRRPASCARPPRCRRRGAAR